MSGHTTVRWLDAMGSGDMEEVDCFCVGKYNDKKNTSRIWGMIGSKSKYMEENYECKINGVHIINE